MRTILMAARKGGGKKTTLARNLPVAAVLDGGRAICLDLDPQGSLRGTVGKPRDRTPDHTAP